MFKDLVMSYISSHCTVAGQRPAAREPGLAAAALLWLRDRWRHTQAIRDLSRLSDRHLEDIGISRADIADVATEMVRRRREARSI
jgi:uncharacterized protein YjiS (DUF1127 family)